MLRFVFEMAGKSVPPGLQRTDLDLDSEQGVFVMPGDEFTIPKDSNKLILGPGLRSIMDPVSKQPVKIVSCKAGILKKTKPNTFFIELKTRSVRNPTVIQKYSFTTKELTFCYICFCFNILVPELQE